MAKQTNKQAKPKERQTFPDVFVLTGTGYDTSERGENTEENVFPKSQEQGRGEVAAVFLLLRMDVVVLLIRLVFRISTLISIPLARHSSNTLEEMEIELRVFGCLRHASHTFPHFRYCEVRRVALEMF